jgi:DNA polymerase
MPSPRDDVRDDKEQVGQRDPGREVIAVDFETYYDKDYTLRKLSTSEYVRDKRFRVLTVAVKIGKGETKCAVGLKAVTRLLGEIPWDDVAMLAHHAHFDGLILSHHFGIRPAYYACSLSMSRGLSPKSNRNDLATAAARYRKTNKLPMPDFKGKTEETLAPEELDKLIAYNIRDVDVMREIFDVMLPLMPVAEMDLIDVTVKMFTQPVLRLDTKLAKQELLREIADREAKMAASGVAEDVLASNKKFPKALEALGVEPPTKISKKTGELAYALSKADEQFTDLLAHPDAKVVALVRGRLAAKSTIGETRAARLIASGRAGRSLPVYLNYCGAHTTRWSGGDKLNYQNLKKQGRLREAIMAPPGYHLVDIDSSQIEARVLAWLAGEEWLLEAFRKGEDPYCIFGEEVYGRPITKKDKLERFVSKTCVLGLGFQMAGPKLQVTILAQSINQGLEPVRLDIITCYTLVKKYRGKVKKTVELWDKMNDEVLYALAFANKGAVSELGPLEYGKGFIRLKGHLNLMYPEVKVEVIGSKKSDWSRGSKSTRRCTDGSYSSIEGRTKLYGGLMTENVVQYLARMVVAHQMLQIAKRYHVVLMAHDAVVFLAKKKEAPAALAWGLEVMKTPPLWAAGLPVSAEGRHGSRYSD